LFGEYKKEFCNVFPKKKKRPSSFLVERINKKQARDELVKSQGYATLQCELCGFKSMLSLISHIRRKHCISMNDYRNKFPNCVVQQASLNGKQNASRSQKKRLEDPENMKKILEWRSFPSEIKHWTRKGFSEEEARQKIHEFQRSQSLKGNNETTRKKRSEKVSGDNNPMSLESISKREGVPISDASMLTPCYGRTGNKHPMFGKKHTKEAITKIGQHINHNGRSKLEHELSDKLVETYGGKKNTHVAGWCCDYVNDQTKLIVEFFGDFWHMNPEKYSANDIHKLMNKIAEQVWSRDARKLRELREQGYEVIVIWESEWRRSKDECIERIKNAYNRIH
jgi:G:T-mismatch repair DNA endonuclease (very short patch repair protein)